MVTEPLIRFKTTINISNKTHLIRWIYIHRFDQFIHRFDRFIHRINQFHRLNRSIHHPCLYPHMHGIMHYGSYTMLSTKN